MYIKMSIIKLELDMIVRCVVYSSLFGGIGMIIFGIVLVVVKPHGTATDPRTSIGKGKSSLFPRTPRSPPTTTTTRSPVVAGSTAIGVGALLVAASSAVLWKFAALRRAPTI
jgi:hypothetical protein